MMQKENQRVKTIFGVLNDIYPEPTTELHYQTPFQLLIAVVLSAQSTDKGVNKATSKFFDNIKEPEDLHQLSQENIEQLIKTIGLYKAKARYLKELSFQLIHHFDSKVPSTREELMTLSGVGRKTANVVLSTLYGHEVIAVDTHVLRVSQRLGLSIQFTPLGVEEDLMLCIPKEMLKDAHHHLILHGRYTCKARRPLCGQCQLKGLCTYPLLTI